MLRCNLSAWAEQNGRPNRKAVASARCTCLQLTLLNSQEGAASTAGGRYRAPLSTRRTATPFYMSDPNTSFVDAHRLVREGVPKNLMLFRLLAVAVAIVGCRGWGFSQSSTANAIDAYLRRYVQSGNFAGSVVVQRDGRVIFQKCYGLCESGAAGSQHRKDSVPHCFPVDAVYCSR